MCGTRICLLASSSVLVAAERSWQARQQLINRHHIRRNAMVAEPLRNAGNLRGLETGGGKPTALRKNRPGGSIGYNLPLNHYDRAWGVFRPAKPLLRDNPDVTLPRLSP